MDDAINTSWQQPNTFMDIIAPRAKNTKDRPLAKSQTLMRSAVKKPLDQTGNSQVIDSPTVETRVQPDHSDSAKLTDQSPLISRFSSNSAYQDLPSEPIAVAETITEQPVIEEPLSSYDNPLEPTIQELAEQNSPLMTPSMDEPSEYPKQQSYDPQGYESPLAAMEPEPAAEAVAAIQPELTNYNLPANYDYSQPKKRFNFDWHQFKKVSGLTVLAIVLVGLVGGGIIINRNFSTLELYLASSKAGFSATLPSIKPSGYNLSGISTASGIIEASFKSNSDNRSYSISEKKSSMTSSALLDNYVQNQAGTNYQTVTTSNKAIYIYDGHDATWVNHGIWYVVQDNNSLSDRQIIDIANSM